MSQYFPKPFLKSFEENINAKVDLSNYADLKNVKHVGTSGFARKKIS